MFTIHIVRQCSSFFCSAKIICTHQHRRKSHDPRECIFHSLRAFLPLFLRRFLCFSSAAICGDDTLSKWTRTPNIYAHFLFLDCLWSGKLGYLYANVSECCNAHKSLLRPGFCLVRSAFFFSLFSIFPAFLLTRRCSFFVHRSSSEFF